MDRNVLEEELGFFYARVLNDNSISWNETRKKLPQAAAFVILVQIFYFIAFEKKKSTKVNVNNASISDIQHWFQTILNVESNPIYQIDLINKLPSNSQPILNQIFRELETWGSNMMEIDILGKIFHTLIPKSLRKYLSAYYSSNIVSDFISHIILDGFEIKRILDPSCGSGTFLVSAYKKLKSLKSELNHQEILNQLYGVDVSIFASQLASINLALQDPLYYSPQYHLYVNDIFKMKIGEKKGNFLPLMDVLMGNPPFTRGDRITSGYKDFLYNHLKKHEINVNYNKKYLGFYGYFLLDSLRFLKPNGTLAYILPISIINSATMNPVLNYLQHRFTFEYFITSDEEIAFSEQSQFKEVIMIAKNTPPTNSSVTKFVVLKSKLTEANYKNLAYFLINNQDIDNHLIRVKSIETPRLLNTKSVDWTLYFHSSSFLNLYTQIKHNNMFKPVSSFLSHPRRDVDRGIRVGVSNFFYLPNKYWMITREDEKSIEISSKETKLKLTLPRSNISPVLRKSSLYHTIRPKISEYILLFPDDTLTDDSMKYIKWGQKKFSKTDGFHALTFNQISQGRKIARVAIIHKFSLNSGRFLAFFVKNKCVISDNFIFIRTGDVSHDKVLAAYFNSTIFLATYLILRREKISSLGQIFGTDLRNFFCLNPKLLANKDSKVLCEAFDEFNRKSDQFLSLKDQIRELSQGKFLSRYRLDFALCQVLQINDIENFIKELYKTMQNEIFRLKI
ncbi:MAG: hypothetical protein EAX86_03150 [Candidatus Heimdallarchaeota archaeon]|nr:hypothetical protein [Candidatus Heimdallarchaeota archaeon]